MCLSKPAALFIGLILTTLFVGCTKDLPTISATHATQLTQAVVLQARLSNDNQQAFLLTRGPVFTQWDIATTRPIKSITAEQLAPDTQRFAVSDDESRLLTSSRRGLFLWLMDNTELLGSMDFRQQLGDAKITSMAFITKSLLVTGNSDGSLIFADLTNKVFRQSHAHSNEVTLLLVGRHKNTLYSAGNDGKVVVTDLQLYETKNQYSTPFRITSLVSNQDNSLLFISDALDQQAFWRPLQNKVISRLDYWQQYRFFRKGLFIENDQRLLTTSPKTSISLWDTQTGEELAVFQATAKSKGSTIMAMQQVRKQQIITLTSDAVIETWDLTGL